MDATEVFENDEKVLIDCSTDTHVFLKRDGELKYSLEESDPEEFPSDQLLSFIEEEAGMEVADIFPVEFTTYVNDDSSTRHMLRRSNLPEHDTGLLDLLYHYPGEIEVTYRLTRSDSGYDVEAVELGYEGKTFTPE